MPTFNPINDTYNDYWIVLEETVAPDENQDFGITKEVSTSNSEYLVFETCLQTFNHFNRNKRHWKDSIIRQMISQPYIQELIKTRNWAGESGHPIGTTGQTTMERIVTIDPNNTCHIITDYRFEGNDKLVGTLETIDDGPGQPGHSFMRSLYQQRIPSFSLRSLVPQRKNPDGSIDVIGPGRLVTYDRVILPSHEQAYMDTNVPVKKVIKKADFEVIMESFTNIMLQKSDKVNHILDGMEPVMETIEVNDKGMVTAKVKEGRVFIQPEMKFRKEIRSLISQFK
jgi:hypothetical protein